MVANPTAAGFLQKLRARAQPLPSSPSAVLMSIHQRLHRHAGAMQYSYDLSAAGIGKDHQDDTAREHENCSHQPCSSESTGRPPKWQMSGHALPFASGLQTCRLPGLPFGACPSSSSVVGLLDTLSTLPTSPLGLLDFSPQVFDLLVPCASAIF